MKITTILLALLSSSSLTASAVAEINTSYEVSKPLQLPSQFHDGMSVDAGFNWIVWGKFIPSQDIRVHYGSTLLMTKTDKNGNWAIEIPASLLHKNVSKLTISAGCDQELHLTKIKLQRNLVSQITSAQ